MGVEEALERGEIPLYKLDELLGSSVKATELRRRFLEKRLGKDLSALKSDLPFDQIVGRNCENTIGAVSIPVGVAGPIRVEGSYARGEYYIPLATTEGALVASVNRGCAAVRESGGALTAVLADAMTRAPVFETPSVRHSVALAEWVKREQQTLKASFSETTRHGEMIDLKPFVAGRYVFLRLEAKTGDAMGMNMVTRGAENVANKIVESNPWARHLALSGNLCTDKKAAAINWVLGRGKTVTAEVTIPQKIIEEKLKTTPEAMEKVALTKLYLGSARAGVLGGFNAHAANIIAAVFLATGQDAAQVVESSLCLTMVEALEDGVYVSVTLPSLEVGTVGGGTWLPAQRTALELMGVSGAGDPPGTNALKMAEIVAATVLAGEVSLIAALAAHHLAKAHVRLGRGGGSKG
ncbi:MAG: hydroxymethylglutaryl-CoA reductase (NADPH) [Nitrososphaerota archaeon]